MTHRGGLEDEAGIQKLKVRERSENRRNRPSHEVVSQISGSKGGKLSLVSYDAMMSVMRPNVHDSERSRNVVRRECTTANVFIRSPLVTITVK
jgi:hypothetical protein